MPILETAGATAGAARPSWRGDGRLLVAVALVVAAGLAAVELRRPLYFLWDDNATQFLPFYAHDWRAATAGELAHVDFHQYLGQIHLGNGQSGVLYPPVYLAAGLARLVWGDLAPTIDLLAAGHLVAAAVGMALLLRGRGRGRAVAALGALVWVTLPFVFQVPRSWISVAYVAALLPFHQLALDRLVAAGARRHVLALAATKALLFLQGQVQWAVLLLLYDVVWLLARGGRAAGSLAATRRVWVRWALAAATGGLLAAPLLLPMLEAQRLSAYRASGLSLVEYLSNSLPLGAAAAAQVLVMRPRAVHLANGAIFHAGLPLLVLAALGAWGARRGRDAAARTTRADVTAAVVALLLSTRAAVLLFPLPVFSSFRWPFKSYLFFLFFALLAAVDAAAATASPDAGRRRWPVALLAAALAGNLVVAAVPVWNAPFGPYRLERDVGELRAAVREILDPDAGRVVSLWQRFLEPDAERHLTFHYATLAGARHLGGYDPLIARRNLELALGVEYSNIYRGALDRRVLAHLERWGVRWLVLPPGRLEERLSRWPRLVPRHRDATVAVWEDTAAWPLVSWADAPRRPLAVDWRTNGLTITTGGRGGTLRVALAPLRWYRWWADGEARGAVGWDAHDQMRVVVPPGTTRVTVRYVDVPFRLGLALAALALLGWAWAAARARSHP